MSYEERPSVPLLAEAIESMKKMGLGLPIWDRPVSSAEIQYFLDRWPFLQILSTNELPVREEVEQLKAPSGWTVLNYGDAFASSPGQFLFGTGKFRRANDEEDDGDGDASLNPGKGTVWRQAFDTATYMAGLAKQLGWTGIHVVDGHAMMKWAIWMGAVDGGLEISGFEPSERDVERRERVKRSAIEELKRFRMQAR